jgi:hypothetical protein
MRLWDNYTSNNQHNEMRQTMREESTAAPTPAAEHKRNIRRKFLMGKGCEFDEFDEFCT